MSESVYKKVGRDIGTVAIANFLLSLAGILLLPVISKTLGVTDYGIYVQVAVSIKLIVGFASLGLPYATVRFLAGVRERKQIQEDLYSTVALILVSSVVIALILVIFSDGLAGLLFEDQITIVKILATLIPVTCMSNILLNIFRTFQEIKKYTILNVIGTYTELGLIALLIFRGYGIVEVIYAMLFVKLFFLVIMAVMVIPRIGVKLPRFTRMRTYLKFSLPTVGSNMANWIINSSDRYIITILLSVTFVGYYNPGYSLGELLLMFMTPANFVLVAVTAKHYEENKIDIVRNLFKYATKYYLLLSIPAMCGVSILARPIIAVLSTPDMAEQGYLITPFIAVSMIISGIGGIAIGKVLYLARKTHIQLMNTIIVAGVNVTLNLILIPEMGIIGAAIATLVSFTVGIAFSSYFALKHFRFENDWRSITKIMIASAVMSGLIINLHPVGWRQLILTILAGFVLYMIVILLLRTISKEEFRYVKSLIGLKQD